MTQARRTGPALLCIAGSGLLAAFFAGGLSWRSERLLLMADPDALASDPAARVAVAAQGRGLYGEQCASCHGGAGEGNPAGGAPSLREHVWTHGNGTAAEIERIVAYGLRSHHPKAWNGVAMPAFATSASTASRSVTPLSPGQIADVADYLVNLRGEPGDPDRVKAGARVYAGVGGCYDCHAPDARGDAAIGSPSLIGPSWIYGDGGREALSASIEEGRAGICPAWIDRLKPAEIRRIALYVYALSHPPVRAAAR